MTTVVEKDLLAALATIPDPHTGTDFVSRQAVQNLRIQGGSVTFDVVLGYPAQSLASTLAAQLEAAARSVAGVQSASAQVRWHIQSHAVQPGLRPLPGVKNIIAVASGKGGVGKSTTSANLALALAAEGARVGVLDADIYGPSQPLLFGVEGQPELAEGMDNMMQPLENYGVQVMSIGFLLDNPDQAMIWRGPMAVQALEQMLRQTHWQDLDYLIIDLPPGTGDIQLTMSQRIPVTGAVIVTTPQDIALLDARKGIQMFEKVHVPILGLVENMALHICSNCGHVEHIFGQDGGQQLAQAKQLPLLASLPLSLDIRQQADRGCPSVVAQPDGQAAGIYKQLAHQVAARVAQTDVFSAVQASPSISIRKQK